MAFTSTLLSFKKKLIILTCDLTWSKKKCEEKINFFLLFFFIAFDALTKFFFVYYMSMLYGRVFFLIYLFYGVIFLFQPSERTQATHCKSKDD